jgi:predicted ATP-grasp superfamily ATP-dependent carboligase
MVERQQRADAGGALVLGGGHVGLGLTRSLGRHGIPVWCLIEDNALPGFSRYCRRRLSWPARETARQRDYLLELGARAGLDGWALYPTSDESAKVLARHHAELAGRYLLTVPAWDIFSIAYDKRLTYRLAEQIGVDIPATYYPGDRDEVAALPCTFPVILKPAIKESDNAFTSGKAWRVENRCELLARYDEASSLVPRDTILVQEMVPGGAAAQLSFAALCTEGDILAWVAARRVRQYPDDFGIATFVVTVEQPAVEPPARRLLAAMHYTGLVEMDFIRDARDDRYYLLDVNPRPWSWHALGRRAGLDFPYLLWEALHGRCAGLGSGKTGARWLHAIPDLQGALLKARQGRLDVAAYARTLIGPSEGAVFAHDDPLPGLMEPALLLRQRLRR